MLRRLFNVAAALSLLLATASAYMWLRSEIVAEAWALEPRPTSGARFHEVTDGWWSFRELESAAGRLVWVEYDVLGKVGPREYTSGWLRPTPPPPVGYRIVATPFTPGHWGRTYGTPFIPPGTVHGRIPGVAEWYSMRPISLTGKQRYIAVTWPAVATFFAVLPAVWVFARWRRGQRARLPAFPVAPAETPSG